MIKFTLTKRFPPNQESPSVDLECMALPRVGEYVSHDQSGIGGTVSEVMYWWDDAGRFQVIQVTVK